jgi:hypothetical protein
MHPKNLPCLTAARIDGSVLANNHALDWGYAGLSETLATLHDGGIRCAGAGEDSTQAQPPAVLDLGAKGRVLVFGSGTTNSGIPMEWAATPHRAGGRPAAGRFGGRVHVRVNGWIELGSQGTRGDSERSGLVSARVGVCPTRALLHIGEGGSVPMYAPRTHAAHPACAERFRSSANLAS